MNYIWAGLIIISLVFAMVNDTVDLVKNTYENGLERSLELRFPSNGDLDRRQDIGFMIPGDTTLFKATWRPTSAGNEMLIPVQDGLPDLWLRIANNQDARDKTVLAAEVQRANIAVAVVVLPEVQFVKLRAIASAAFEMAEFAVTLALGLIGIMALWLGMMRIAEKSGLIEKLVVVVAPLMRKLFPNVPENHPAMGAISLNMTANILGLGNAATPMGIKAMEELQKLNPNKETATNAMCMFLAINTSSVQIVPPVTLIALMGIGVSELFFSILITTIISTIVAISAALWFAKRNPEPPYLLEEAD
jgi:spore maturation protein A